MFSTAEFVEEWNQIFSFKIKESDLAKPTETFVFNALLNYLKMFNFDTSPMIQIKQCENATEKRAFLVRFCNYIDHIYKISDKSNCFLIYDLKHPSPKKTVHMLNHLLNYFFYYNMFKESIVPIANGKICQRQELIDEIKKCKFDHEQIAIRAKNIEKHIKNLRPLAPETLTQLNEIIDAEASQKESINCLEERMGKCNLALEALCEEEARLGLDIVATEEVDRLQSTKTILENAIDEQLIIERSTFKKNQDRSVSMTNLQNVMARIESSMELSPPTVLQSFRDYANKNKELETKLTEISQRKETLKAINEKLVEDMKKIEIDCAAKTKLLSKQKISGEKQIKEMKMLAESNESSIADSEHDLHNTEKQLADEKNVTEYILETTALLVRVTTQNVNEQ